MLSPTSIPAAGATHACAPRRLLGVSWWLATQEPKITISCNPAVNFEGGLHLALVQQCIGLL